MCNRKIFNALAGGYSNNWTAGEIAHIKKIIAAARIKKGMRVLDAGSGKGDFASFLVKKGARVTLADCSEKMLSYARRRFRGKKNVKIRRCDVAKTPFKNGEFGVVFCFNCFPHFYPKETAVVELARTLKKGGILLIAHTASRKAVNSFHKKCGFDTCTHYLPGLKVMKAMVKKAGFSAVRASEKPYYFFYAKKTK